MSCITKEEFLLKLEVDTLKKFIECESESKSFKIVTWANGGEVESAFAEKLTIDDIMSFILDMNDYIFENQQFRITIGILQKLNDKYNYFDMSIALDSNSNSYSSSFIHFDGKENFTNWLALVHKDEQHLDDNGNFI